MFATVTRQLKRASSAVKSVLAVAPTTAAELDPRVRPYLEPGQELDGFGPIQIGLVRWIQDDHQRLECLETDHRDALRVLARYRKLRDDQQEVLYSKTLRIRQVFEDAFGQGLAAVYLGLEPRLGRAEPLDLRRHAREAADILADPDFQPPEPQVRGLWQNSASYAEQIRDVLTPFEETLDDIETQKREVEKALKAKTDLLNELDKRLTWSIRFFEAIYQLSGQGFHAERLRFKVASRSPQNGDKPKEEGSESDPDEESESSEVREEAEAESASSSS